MLARWYPVLQRLTGTVEQWKNGCGSVVTSLSSHCLYTDCKSSHTIKFCNTRTYRLHRGILEGQLTFNVKVPLLNTIQRRMKPTTIATKSVLMPGSISGKKSLKGPRTKQPSRANLPAPEEVCYFLCYMEI